MNDNIKILEETGEETLLCKYSHFFFFANFTDYYGNYENNLKHNYFKTSNESKLVQKLSCYFYDSNNISRRK